MFDYSTFMGLVANQYGSNSVELSPSTIVLCNLLNSAASSYQFTDGDNPLSPSQKDEIDQAIAQMFYEINNGNPIIPIAEETFFSDDTPDYDTITTTSPGMLGFRFKSAVDGQMLSIRVWRPPTASDGYWATLFASDGSTIDNKIFPTGTDGWIEAVFDTPVTITAETEYIAAVYAPDATYALKINYYASDVVSGNLTALADNPSGNRNGVFCVCSQGTFPTAGYFGISFFVDVRFVADG